jgi:hypothetical protein
MKNLGKTIDRIIKVDPDLEEKLVSIKNKWKRSPSKTINYWNELLALLNANPEHPKRLEFKNIISPRKKVDKKQLYSFEEILPTDRNIGALPEGISDIIKRHDRQSIEVAKLRVEAGLTRNETLLAEVYRKEVLLDINSKKIWLAIKDHFNLWNKPTGNYSIKKYNGLLVLIEPAKQGMPPAFLGPGIVKMDHDTLKQFMRYLGMDVPPEENNSNDDSH